jgi:hypothetical protein
MQFIENLQISNPIVHTDEGIIFLDKPARLNNIPNIDIKYINEKYTSICTSEYIESYFKQITENHFRLKVFNGLLMGEDLLKFYYCDYCGSSINENWYYCFDCHSDMCKLCYEEDEKTIIKKRAKNYKLREYELNNCRSHNKIKYRPVYKMTELKYCDICEYVFETSDDLYTLEKEGENSFDICMNCYKNDETKDIVIQKEMKLVKAGEDRKNYLFSYTDFGSLLYWIPIISDTEQCHVLMNLNPDDKNYGKLCLQSCDDHGRFGYYIFYDENMTLDMLLQKLKNITDRGVVDDIDNIELCSEHHSSPIQVMMQELKIPVYYG